MTCTDCRTAERNPHWPIYQAACRSCSARGLAKGFAFWESGREGRMTPDYRDSLIKVFGDGGWEAGHRQVKRWAERLKNTAAADAA